MHWDVDTCRELLKRFPRPLFRMNDAYEVCSRYWPLAKHHGTGLWCGLQKHGLIVRTATPIGKARRRFYWERTEREEQEPGAWPPAWVTWGR